MAKRLFSYIGLLFLLPVFLAVPLPVNAQSTWVCGGVDPECCTVTAVYGGGAGTANCSSPGQVVTCNKCTVNSCSNGVCCTCDLSATTKSCETTYYNQYRTQTCNCTSTSWSAWTNCAVGGINKCDPVNGNTAAVCVECEENDVPAISLNRYNVCDWGVEADSCRYDCIGTTGYANVSCYSTKACFLKNDGPCYYIPNVESAGCEYAPSPTPVSCPFSTCSWSGYSCQTSGTNAFSVYCVDGSIGTCTYCPGGCSGGLCLAPPPPTPTPTPKCNAITCQNLYEGTLCPWPNEKTGIFETVTWCPGTDVYNCDTCGGLDCGYESECDGPEPTSDPDEPPPTATPTLPPPPPNVSSCEVEVVGNQYDENSPPVITYSGYTVNAGEKIRIWLEQKLPNDFAAVIPVPARGGTPLTPVTVSMPGYNPDLSVYYLLTECTTGSDRHCPPQVNVSTGIDNLIAGEYFVHCDSSANLSTTQKCSGNPACDFKSLGYTIPCSASWSQCDLTDLDYDYFEVVTAPPTPTPEVIIQARGRRVNDDAQIDSCLEITEFDWTDGAEYTLDPPDTQKSQVNDSYASWTVNEFGFRTLYIPEIPSYSLRACLSVNGSALNEREAPASSVQTVNYTAGGTYTWEIGYAPADGWFQARGADTYSQGLNIVLPEGFATTDPTHAYFLFNDTPESSDGVVISTNSINISNSNSGKVTESHDWQARISSGYASAADLVTTLQTRMLGVAGDDACPTGCTPADLQVTEITNCVNGNTEPVCYLGDATDITIDDPFTIATDAIVVIDGDLNINANVTHNAANFLAFVVTGNITVDDDVGSDIFIAANDFDFAEAQLQGIFMAGGSFTVNATGANDDKQLRVYGTVVASDIALSRFNPAETPTNPMEIFRYNPRLLLTMPDIMQDIPVVWGEVVPN